MSGLDVITCSGCGALTWHARCSSCGWVWCESCHKKCTPENPHECSGLHPEEFGRRSGYREALNAVLIEVAAIAFAYNGLVPPHVLTERIKGLEGKIGMPPQ